MRTLGAALCIGAFAVWCAPAGAADSRASGLLFGFSGPGVVFRQTLVPVSVRGRVDVEFHGEPVAGCETHGTCDLQGSLVWRPPRAESLVVLEAVVGRRRESTAFLFATPTEPPAGAPGLLARVVRTGRDGRPRTCTDAQDADAAAGDARVQGNSLLVRGADRQGPVFVTRCGGPLDADIDPGLPERRLSLAAARRGGLTIDLRGERPFSAHGFSGTVRSSIVLRLGSPRVASGEAGDEGPSPDSPFRLRRTRRLVLTYAVERVAGAMTTSFEGIPDPDLCEPLGACDLSGFAKLVPQASRGTAEVDVTGSARLPWRVLRAAVGLAPGGRVGGLRVLGSVEWRSSAGSVTQAVTRTDGSSCSDVAPVRRGFLDVTAPRNVARFSFGGGGDNVDALRTRCPGPLAADAIVHSELASGSLPLAALGARRVVVRLIHGPGFRADGYHGRTAAGLTIVLRRVRVRRSTFDEPVLRGAP